MGKYALIASPKTQSAAYAYMPVQTLVQFIFEYHRGHVAGSEHGDARADADIRPGSSSLSLCAEDAEGRDEEQRSFFHERMYGFSVLEVRFKRIPYLLCKIPNWYMVQSVHV